MPKLRLSFQFSYNKYIKEQFSNITRKITEIKTYLEKVPNVSRSDDIQEQFSSLHYKCRKQLAGECTEIVKDLIHKLTHLLLINIDEIADMINDLLGYNGVEASSDEKNKLRVYYNKKFGVLIQRLTRPAISLLIEAPRNSRRLPIMRKYQSELLILDSFDDNDSTTEPHGILSFLANGKYGDIQINSEIPVTLQEAKSASSLNSSRRTVLTKGANSKTGLKQIGKFFPEIHKKEKSVGDDINKESTIFDLLKFSPSSQNSDEVYQEIKSDLDEFIACEHINYSKAIKLFSF